MKIYLVGGAVRDKLLGVPVKERDWVVVGASEQDMIKLGYRQVGKEFPVFLHPKTSEEYALARMERKVSPGYQGFTFDTSPDVDLEDDLVRRDLTINAMAESETGKLIDPYHGKEDLEKRILRHVSSAFGEDPVRILRVGRFLARYAPLGFTVAPETIELMREMVNAGEVNALVAERVWKELERSLGEPQPEKFFEVLDECHALPILFPDLTVHGAGMQAMQKATALSDKKTIRFAALLYALPDAKTAVPNLCNRYRTPNVYRELAAMTAQYHERALQIDTLTAREIYNLFGALDIYRREPRFQDFLIACQAIAAARGATFNHKLLNACAQAAKSISAKELIAQGFHNHTLAAKLRKDRLEKIETCLKTNKDESAGDK